MLSGAVSADLLPGRPGLELVLGADDGTLLCLANAPNTVTHRYILICNGKLSPCSDFQLSAMKPRPKQSLWSITNYTHKTMNQSKLKENTLSRRKMRENKCE